MIATRTKAALAAARWGRVLRRQFRLKGLRRQCVAIALCCAGAASGHAKTEPPSSIVNLRRLMVPSDQGCRLLALQDAGQRLAKERSPTNGPDIAGVSGIQPLEPTAWLWARRGCFPAERP
jgi:hypothetical protein